MKEHDAVIIGAGAAGLAAAWELSHAGRSAAVIEARPRIGAVSGAIASGKRAARELLRELRP